MWHRISAEITRLWPNATSLDYLPGHRDQWIRRIQYAVACQYVLYEHPAESLRGPLKAAERAGQ
jgi:hypothetical protein